MDSETVMYVFLLIIVMILLYLGLSERLKKAREAQNETDVQLNKLNINTEKYYIENNGTKIGIDVEERKVFQAGIKGGDTIFTDSHYRPNVQIIDLNNVIDVQIIEDNQVTSKVSNSSMIGRALVGGALTGGVGAIIGGSTAKSSATNMVKEINLRFRMNDMDNPYYDIPVFSHSTGLDRGNDLFKSKYKDILNLFGRIELVLESDESIS